MTRACRRAARRDDKLQVAAGESTRRKQRLVRDSQARRDAIARDREVDLARHRRHQGIGDRERAAFGAHSLASVE